MNGVIQAILVVGITGLVFGIILSIASVIFAVKKDERINILVAKAFVPNPYNKPIVHHIDTDKLNNDVSNLVWLTTAEHGKAHRILNQQAS